MYKLQSGSEQIGQVRDIGIVDVLSVAGHGLKAS